MAVIGFLTYEDFLTELKSRPTWGIPVRVQQGCTAKPSDQYDMIQRYTFSVEAAIELPNPIDSPDTLVCRFITGRATVMTDHDRGKLAQLNLRNKRAADILEQTLRGEGFTTGPGLIAAAEQSKTEADPGDLWTAEDLASLASPGETKVPA